MNRRTCVCGAAIVCADYDGHDVWLDAQPHPDGWFRHLAGGRVVLDLGGAFRRHTCAADVQPPRYRPKVIRLARLKANNQRRAQASAARNIAAIRTVLAGGGQELTELERRVATIRVSQPDATCAELADASGLARISFHNALRRVRVRADQLTNQAA